jgi:hypothetical protein
VLLGSRTLFLVVSLPALSAVEGPALSLPALSLPVVSLPALSAVEGPALSLPALSLPVVSLPALSIVEVSNQSKGSNLIAFGRVHI